MKLVKCGCVVLIGGIFNLPASVTMASLLAPAAYVAAYKYPSFVMIREIVNLIVKGYAVYHGTSATG
jgi:hypothetical protein